jgi:NACalpha-BTF3-like transcription factor
MTSPIKKNGMIRIVLAFVIICCSNFCKAQVNSECFSKHQIFKIQASSLDEIRMFLNNEGWAFDGAKSNQPFNYFDYHINYDVVKWEKSSNYNIGRIFLYTANNKPNIVIYQSNSYCFNNLLTSFNAGKGRTSIDDDKLVTIFKEGPITIEFREYKNDYSSRQFSILIYNAAALNYEIQISKKAAEALKAAEEERNQTYHNAIAEGDMLFVMKDFETAKVKYLIALEIENNDLVQSKIDLCNKAICDALVSKGDSLFNENQYDGALKMYVESKECSHFSPGTQEKIKLTEKKILEARINAILNQADFLFNDKKFKLALQQYNAVLLLDPSNMTAINGVKRIQEIMSVLEKRRTSIFSYEKTNGSDLRKFQNLLLKDLEAQINTINEGYLNMKYFISYDTLGNNLSQLENISTSLPSYTTNLTSLLSSGVLNPSMESGYFLAAREHLILDLKWGEIKMNLRSNSKGLFYDDYSSQDISSVRRFIYSQPFNYGRYTLGIKRKEVNGKVFSDINLVKYTTVGPEAALLSMLMPGMGTLKVTYGKKGWGRFTGFLLSTGLAIGSKLYSDSQYQSYLLASSQPDIDSYYNNANLTHKIALISAGISASIYLYDIIWVLVRGSKNLKATRSLRRQLQSGPIPLQNQQISW